MDNGEIVINPVYYNDYLSAIGNSVKQDKTKNFIIMLLGLNNEYIRGRIMLVKEAFMFLNNMKDIIKDSPQIAFYPHRYGPYSRYLIDKMRELQDNGLISIDHERIQLTEKGNNVLSSIKNEYTPQEWASLEEYRKKLDQKGTDGIMRVVYELYPEYTINSVVKDKYAKNLRNNGGYSPIPCNSIRDDKAKNFVIMLLGLSDKRIIEKGRFARESYIFLKDKKDVIKDMPQLPFYSNLLWANMDIKKRYRAYLADKIEDLQDNGLISIDHERIQLTEKGNNVLSSIKNEYTPQEWASLEEYLKNIEQKHNKSGGQE